MFRIARDRLAIVDQRQSRLAAAAVEFTRQESRLRAGWFVQLPPRKQSLQLIPALRVHEDVGAHEVRQLIGCTIPEGFNRKPGIHRFIRIVWSACNPFDRRRKVLCSGAAHAEHEDADQMSVGIEQAATARSRRKSGASLYDNAFVVSIKAVHGAVRVMDAGTGTEADCADIFADRKL